MISLNHLEEAKVDKDGNVELENLILIWNVKYGFLDRYGNF